MSVDTAAPPKAPLMNTKQASEYLLTAHGVTLSHRTLQGYRETGKGPASAKIASRVYYSQESLDAFVAGGFQ